MDPGLPKWVPILRICVHGKARIISPAQTTKTNWQDVDGLSLDLTASVGSDMIHHDSQYVNVLHIVSTVVASVAMAIRWSRLLRPSLASIICGKIFQLC